MKKCRHNDRSLAIPRRPWLPAAVLMAIFLVLCLRATPA